MCKLRLSAALAAVVATFAAIVTASAGGEQPGGTRYEIEASARVRGLAHPYFLRVRGNRSSAEQELHVDLSRRIGAGAAAVVIQHQWEARDGARLSCQTDLSGCTLVGGAAYARVLEVNLKFEPSGSPSTRAYTCASTGDTLMTRTRQPGRFTGTIRLDTRTAYFGIITNGTKEPRVPVMLKATATKWIETGSNCPEAPERCEVGLQVASGTPNGRDGFALVQRPRVNVLVVAYAGRAPAPGLTLTHAVRGVPALGTFDDLTVGDLSLSEATIHLDRLSPVVTGDLAWTAEGDGEVSNGERCLTLVREGALEGTVAADFDGFGQMEWAKPVPATTVFTARVLD